MTQLLPFDTAAYELTVKTMILEQVGCPVSGTEAWDSIMEESSRPDKPFDGHDIIPWTPCLRIGGKNVLEGISVIAFQSYLLKQITMATFALPDFQTVIPNDDDPQQVKVEMYHNGISVLSHPNKDGYYTRETLVDFCDKQTIRYREDPNDAESCEQEFKIVATL